MRMLTSFVLGQSPESKADDNLGCTCKNLGHYVHADIQRDAYVKIAAVLIFGEIEEQAVH